MAFLVKVSAGLAAVCVGFFLMTHQRHLPDFDDLPDVPPSISTLFQGNSSLVSLKPSAELLKKNFNNDGRNHSNNSRRESIIGDNTLVKHPVILIPGLVTTKLELWRSDRRCMSSKPPRGLLWGGPDSITGMLVNAKCWLQHISLDPNGSDPDGIRVRASEGFSAIDALGGLYWVWSPIIENLAEIGYLPGDSLHAAPFDWRIPLEDLEARDAYFSRLKSSIEVLVHKRRNGEKAVVISHSYGSLVTLAFLDWVPEGWAERYIESFVSIGGPFSGVPKAISALTSGEMKDTADLSGLSLVLKERFYSRFEIMTSLRSFASVPAMLPTGGDRVWKSSLKDGNMVEFKGEQKDINDADNSNTNNNSNNNNNNNNNSSNNSSNNNVSNNNNSNGNNNNTNNTTASPGIASAYLETDEPGVPEIDREWLASRNFSASESINVLLRKIAPQLYKRITEDNKNGENAANENSKKGGNAPIADGSKSRGRFASIDPWVTPPRFHKGMKVFALFGTDLPTEVGYHYRIADDPNYISHVPFVIDTSVNVGIVESPDPSTEGPSSGDNNDNYRKNDNNDNNNSDDYDKYNNDKDNNGNSDRKSFTHSTVQSATTRYATKRGVKFVDGDGTVPAASLAAVPILLWGGAMDNIHLKNLSLPSTLSSLSSKSSSPLCKLHAVNGNTSKNMSCPMNPSHAKVFVREYNHDPGSLLSSTARTTVSSGDHVDIMGNNDLILDILKIASGLHSDEFGSKLGAHTAKIVSEIARNFEN